VRHTSRETKVTYLNVAVLVNQNIGRLDVPVHDIGLMNLVQNTEHVIHDYDDMVFRQLGRRIIHHLI
jgi:hypothetical protein